MSGQKSVFSELNPMYPQSDMPMAEKKLRLPWLLLHQIIEYTSKLQLRHHHAKTTIQPSDEYLAVAALEPPLFLSEGQVET